MATIIVVADAPGRIPGTILHQERVHPPHLHDAHSAAQIVERIAMAVEEAERDAKKGTVPSVAE